MRRRERGFTLLEVLIALAIVGALLTIALGGVRVALAAWRRGEDRAEAHQHVRGVAVSLARTVGGAYPYQARARETSEPAVLFRGTAARLELVTQRPPFPFAMPLAFTAVVVALDESEERRGLVIRQRALPNWEPFAEAAVVFHDPTVTRLELTYLDESGAWQDDWKAEETGALPRAVRITLGTSAEGRAATLPPITVSLRVGAP
ncbi:MAG: hypothetical protein A3E31_01380 [Candidatus Rokubacteria bacterium RIFCSPHIGHO2_12_FULL_73_22]|nr:MAG: hypothetical protein A3E31_01380 [Candidatus Rokubacteria bacterium RIFCSPHIGHO2_12_FULL_73_22]OGL01371.1 MAG: hypothetical protein A3D33_11275 [Candidatus Rokubacteria bacterium RIFCSPHIGHO2_02_FULL_73_26]OGL12790.1 MAG: hypothetical protein A3I14_17350 [Candidatus Rokubacteria bacterium RIFCSPLOWO2_02_FULL_73_56]OGL27317.1 MAG: hypothetical protein A3G44_14035 [Candidatus Rokubacteria bacterium RIFCSPLOWO2_12_FULL_73_47]